MAKRKSLVESLRENDRRNGNGTYQPPDQWPEGERGEAWEPCVGSVAAVNGTGENPSASSPWPDPPGDAAYYGLAGEIVRAIEPQSEADPVALLVQTLVAFGNVIGRSANFRVEGDRHFMNLFMVLVGETAKARKGTSWGRIRHLFEEAEPDWTAQRIMSGLSSGEGLVWNVRDAIVTREKVKERGHVTGTQEVESDPGVSDKRLLAQEPEFAVILRQIERHGNTLSTNIRQAWDRGDLGSLTKNSPVRATKAHISIVAISPLRSCAGPYRQPRPPTDSQTGFFGFV